jgi:hypothetical protein
MQHRKGDIVNKAMLVGLMAIAVPAAAFGQDPAPASIGQETPPAAVGVPAPATVTMPQRAAPAVLPVEKRRQAIRMMEAILSQAVRGGAESLAEQLGSGNPNMSFFTGQARARGFILEGYGVFFYVEIPEMQQSLVMSISALERDTAVSSTLESLRRTVSGMPDGALKLQAEQALKALQYQVGPLPQVAELQSAATRDVLRAADAVPIGEPVAAASADPMTILRDPQAAYRDAIKLALVDAMLEHSRGMNIQPDEWLSVAAQRGDSLLSPNEIVTSSTLVLRIKGSDLAIYDADRTRKEEIRRRVEVREF